MARKGCNEIVNKRGHGKGDKKNGGKKRKHEKGTTNSWQEKGAIKMQ